MMRFSNCPVNFHINLLNSELCFPDVVYETEIERALVSGSIFICVLHVLDTQYAKLFYKKL
jgi:hypothetical protein